MNLTLAQLTADLARIHAHGLAETNVTEIQHTPGGGVLFSVNASELETQLAHASADLTTTKIELRSAIDRIKTLEDYIHDLEKK